MLKRGLRRGFTLVELLVVIAIIGILVALLLPAIQAAREAGRRISCGNNIKQLVLGMQTYHDVHQSLPISYGNNHMYGIDSTGKSWMIGILPFIEQKPIYDQIRWDPTPSATYDDVGVDPNDVNTPNARLADTVIKAFMCPSDGDNGRGRLPGRANAGDTTRAITNYKACCGANWAWPGSGGQLAEDIQPAPSPGDANGLDRGNGIICRNADNQPRNYHGLEFVTDGTANTFAIGEAVPAWCTHSWWWWWNGTTATCGNPLNYKPSFILDGTHTLEQQATNWPNNYSFMSRHATGGQFGMCDGAVKFVPETVDFTTYKRLATAAGGRPAQLPQ
jgi:prepilin-type N-terminal cleavage/methylation domain-containing protein